MNSISPRLASSLFVALLSLLFAGTGLAQPVNDDLADAVAIGSVPYAGTGSNVGASVEAGEAANAYGCTNGYDMDNSVWWSYTPSEDGTLIVDTFGSSFDTMVSIWSGSSHPLSELACSNNYGEASDVGSRATSPVEAGRTYYIRVIGSASSAQGTEGDIALNVDLVDPPANDDLADAVAISTLPFTGTGTNVGATSEASEDMASNSVWWQYTPSEKGLLTVDTYGSDIDTRLVLYTGSGHPLDREAYASGSDRSELSIRALAGETYYIRVSGSTLYGPKEGNITLNVSLSPLLSNDDLADAEVITGMPFTDSATNDGATVEPLEEGPGTSVWWQFTPSSAGLLTVDTYGSDYNTTLGIWTGDGHPLTRQAYSNDAGDGEQSEITISVEAGSTYYIRVAGAYDAEGNITLNASLAPPIVNDDLANATVIDALPFSGTASNAGATVEPDEEEPSYSCASGDGHPNSIWWSYTATQDGILSVDTEGTSFNNVLSVWTGSGHPLTQLDCSKTSDATRYPTWAKLAIEAGTTYYIRVAGATRYGDTAGEIHLNVSYQPPITNDDLAAALPVTSMPFDTTASNVGATQEADELLPTCSEQADKSVWWSYTPQEDGILTVDSDSSEINVVLSIWTGSGHPLTEVTCNDGRSSTTTVTTPVEAGQTYYVRAADYYGGSGGIWSEGDIRLKMKLDLPLVNDDLADATVIDALPYTATEPITGATAETDEVLSSCGSEATNSIWWRYTAGEEGVLTVSTAGSDPYTVAGIWSGEGHPLTEIACDHESGEDYSSLVARPVAAGETYYIRISGEDDRETGEVSVSVTLDAPLPNDDLADATVIEELPFSGTGTNVGATQETGEELASCKDEAFEANSVWWKYTATEYGSFLIDTDGSDFDTMFSIWTGDAHPLELQGCTDSSDAEFINVEAGTTYFIRVTGYEGEQGNISLSITFLPPDPVYVDLDAAGANDGSSWADAYTDLHVALTEEPDEIWVAEGVYANGGTDFNLPSGTRIYGGFDGSEAERQARDWTEHETVLTGSSDHVLRAMFDVGRSTVLDGFTVRGGNADGTEDGSDPEGRHRNGGGLYVFEGGSPTIVNVLFEENSAVDNGGAVYLDCSGGRGCRPLFRDVTFRGNSADGDGGAIYMDGEDQGFAAPDLINVVFAENSAGGRGGAIEIWAGLSGFAEPDFVNVVFANNTALAAGGAIYNSNAGGTGGESTVTFTNATFYGNSAHEGGAIYNYGLPLVEGTVSIHLNNSIIWGNNDDQGNPDDLYTHAEGEMHLRHTLAKGGCPVTAECTDVIEADPAFQSTSSAAGADRIYRTEDDGLRLLSSSPAVDAGDDAVEELEFVEFDLVGRERVSGAGIDLGAYESGSSGEPTDLLDPSGDDRPEQFALHGGFPNPFQQSATIRYDLPEPAPVRLEVFDALGRRVVVLVDEQQTAGAHTERFDASSLPAGVYVLRLQAADRSYTRQMVHVR